VQANRLRHHHHHRTLKSQQLKGTQDKLVPIHFLAVDARIDLHP